ncbi:methyltransferase Fsa4 [Penicillium malachiteum]|uniref:methyltransferase Fsa4 n=1 Tax=Penicillium malachiteum TaxID=1324776 RepID=UPI002548A3E0|nr:methyltransferase Fsa4 [Penicillium malachiteum]KAJ5737002.1 methyltransferase Fsa4 [Penicillium malachiteum]
MPSISTRFPEAPSILHGYLCSMVELGVLRFFFEYGVFKAIPKTGISISDLAAETGVDAGLLERHANFLIAAEVLNSSQPGHIEHTSVSRYLKDPRSEIFFPYIFDSFMTPAARWPDYFRSHENKEPKTSSASVFGFATGHPDKSFYEVMKLEPERVKSFNNAMALPLDDMPYTTGVYDFEWVGDYAKNDTATPSRTCVVDIGGGKGQALKVILEDHPSIPASSCIIEDQEGVVKQGTEEASGVLAGVQRKIHNFFDEQPVQGALVYFIRRVLNDWPDEDCVQILSKVRSACAPDSRVVLSENLLPDEPSLTNSGIDLWMMNFGGKRRNARMFEDLASRSGFKVTAVTKDEATSMGVVEMMPAS